MAQAKTDDKPWVLIVDDSRVVRRTIMNQLGPGFHVLEAGDGAAGWRMLRQNSRVEAVITDIQMPEMDGYSFICKVRAMDDPALRDIPMIVITSAEDEITRERAYACGANDFILKPFHADQLLPCVQNQISEYRKLTAEGLTADAPVTVPVRAPEVIPITLDDAGPATVDTALEHFDQGIEVLRSLKTAQVAPRALDIVLRFLPLLKYCNTRFALGIDRELAVLQRRVATAKAANADASGQALN